MTTYGLRIIVRFDSEHGALPGWTSPAQCCPSRRGGCVNASEIVCAPYRQQALRLHIEPACMPSGIPCASIAIFANNVRFLKHYNMFHYPNRMC